MARLEQRARMCAKGAKQRFPSTLAPPLLSPILVRPIGLNHWKWGTAGKRAKRRRRCQQLQYDATFIHTIPPYPTNTPYHATYATPTLGRDVLTQPNTIHYWALIMPKISSHTIYPANLNLN